MHICLRRVRRCFVEKYPNSQKWQKVQNGTIIGHPKIAPRLVEASFCKNCKASVTAIIPQATLQLRCLTTKGHCTTGMPSLFSTHTHDYYQATTK